MKILILRVSAIGDVVHTLPAIFLLKMLYPSVDIHWVVQEKAASLIENQPFLERVWVLPDKYWNYENWGKTFRILRELSAIEWDVIFDFQGILKTSLLLLFLRGQKIGFSHNHARMSISSFFTNYHVEPRYTNIIQKNCALVASMATRNVLAQYLNPAYATTSPSLDTLKKTMMLSISEHEKQAVKTWLHDNKLSSFIILSPNTTWASKLWPFEYWLTLFKSLLKTYPSYKVVVLGAAFGGPAKKLLAQAQSLGLPLYPPPNWSLLSTTYLIQHAQLLIAPDTGLLHIADFLGMPSIGIFGPTLAQKHGPFLSEANIKQAVQISCSHSYAKRHHTFDEKNPKNCMFQLKPADLMQKITAIL
jgi:heptosyltransferase-1